MGVYGLTRVVGGVCLVAGGDCFSGGLVAKSSRIGVVGSGGWVEREEERFMCLILFFFTWLEMI